jgi:hypothetical protein
MLGLTRVPKAVPIMILTPFMACFAVRAATG